MSQQANGVLNQETHRVHEMVVDKDELMPVLSSTRFIEVSQSAELESARNGSCVKETISLGLSSTGNEPRSRDGCG